MTPFKIVKVTTICVWVLGVVLWASTSGTLSQSKKPNTPPASAPTQSDDYVGTETCASCHETQHNNFSKTSHSKLANDASWKGKVVGCEACHGPGRAHVEAGGDPKLIRNFKNETAKQSSETCLACHSGKEDHNNFRRGEHWRNNVGCLDCHFSHEPDPLPNKPESLTLVADNSRQRVDTSALKLLRGNETQLCLKCHTEQKAQFSMPFRHKVLEGQMKCSDCHNPHGGFETQQLRLTTGTDAACVKCHSDKQGPFTFEHEPVKVEGCSICHTPHGTSNPKLLNRSNVFQLCIECHTNAHQLILREDGGAPAPPSFHDLRTERIRNCTTCHTAIHGSNTHNFFFRQ